MTDLESALRRTTTESSPKTLDIAVGTSLTIEQVEVSRVTTTAKTITWALYAVWAVTAVIFLIKFHSFVDHPVAQSGGGGGGGIFLVISQAALGAAVILIWQLRGNEA